MSAKRDRLPPSSPFPSNWTDGGQQPFLVLYNRLVEEIEAAMIRRFPYSWSKEKTYLVWRNLGEELV
jgi:hypothetical protein